MEDFAIGMYRVEWHNADGKVIRSEEKYLTVPGYRREIINMQTAFLRGVDVAQLVVVPIED